MRSSKQSRGDAGLAAPRNSLHFPVGRTAVIADSVIDVAVTVVIIIIIVETVVVDVVVVVVVVVVIAASVERYTNLYFHSISFFVTFFYNFHDWASTRGSTSGTDIASIELQ